jgi:hypothetical protein
MLQPRALILRVGMFRKLIERTVGQLFSQWICLGKFLIGHKKNLWFLIDHKKLNFFIDHWVDFFFLLVILMLKLENKFHFCTWQHFYV